MSPISRICAVLVLILFPFVSEATRIRPVPNPPAVRREPPPADSHSYARPEQVVVRHMSLDLTVDFERTTLSGSVRLELENLTGARELILDSDDLNISSVTYSDGSSAPFTLGASDPILGRPLTIAIRDDTSQVTIQYSTARNASGVFWMSSAMTTDRQGPLLYTQNETIFARSWIPSQDTPSTRLTYDATIRVPPSLMALMSAENPTSRSPEGIYRFRMPRSIPVYLVALAVGNFEFRDLGEGVGVYAEPSVLERAARELSDTAAMRATAERLWGPYYWERYDILVLPRGYHYSGMEHPRLTFVNPFFITGDKSRIDLIAHELAHSWAGNLVTTANWNHMWLNEGITTYMERRILEETYGADFANGRGAAALSALRDAVRNTALNGLDTRLRQSLEGDNPERSFSIISYEKGYAFMRMLEERLGRDSVDRFLRTYFREFGFQWMDSETFVAVLTREIPLSQEQIRELRIEEWIFSTGLPENAPTFPSAVESDVVDATFRALLREMRHNRHRQAR